MIKVQIARILYVGIAFAFIFNPAFPQKQRVTLDRVEPPSWWVGMKDPRVQLLVKGENIRDCNVAIDYEGITITDIHAAASPNYLFIDLLIDERAKPGSFPIDFTYDKRKKVTYNYTLMAREKVRHGQQGLDVGDVVYLVMPDRFKNGDPSNDEVPLLAEKKNRDFHSGRHGGDIAGLISGIPYLDDLGVTALWINPLLENNMPRYSYHGYATTDYYKTDARFGTNKDYRRLADSLHAHGMKLIMDMIFNHCGSEHWWMKDMPFKDWIHNYPDTAYTNHAKDAVSDPYAANSDGESLETGWFVKVMPDLNHDNPYLARYLMQNSMWWIEYAGLDGIRMDTYLYCKPAFMAAWAQHVYDEYPDFYIVGENWVDNEADEAFWSGKKGQHEFNTYLNSNADFPLCFAMNRVFTQGWYIGALYQVLTNDFLYEDPFSNMIFVDNHDMDRFYHTIGKDLNKWKMAMTFLFTTRGIPEITYGTEILMTGHGPDGVRREDFPGGWPGDTRNAFTTAGRTPEENEAFDFLRTLLQWRAGSDAILHGGMKHFMPYDNVYIYNRKSDKQTVVVIINNNDEAKHIDLARYREILSGHSRGKDVFTGETLPDLNTVDVPAWTALLMELQ